MGSKYQKGIGCMTYTMEILLKYLLFLFWYLVFSIFFQV